MEEMGAAVVEVHAALLIDERLQQLEFGFADGDGLAVGST